MDSKIIAVIGAPGVGKSFLSKKLSEKLNAELILEEDIKIHPKIIENFKNNSRHMETILWFKLKIIKDTEKAVALKNIGRVVVMDTYLLSNELHVTTMTSGFEQELLLNLADFERKYIPQPDIVIFLDASSEKIKELTFKRGRDFDTTEEFLTRNLSIKKAHDEYLSKNKNSVIYINRDNLDFENEESLDKIVEEILIKIR